MKPNGMPIPDEELPITLETPGGNVHKLGPLDIVEVFPRNRKGELNPHKSEVFQGINTKLPKGFRTTDTREALGGISKRAQREFGLMAQDHPPEPEYAENFTLPEEPAIRHPSLDQRQTRFDPNLETLSRAISQLNPFGAPRRVTQIASDSHDVSWVHYPMPWGRKINLVLPTGELIQGRAGDRFEEVVTQGDTHTVLHRASLKSFAEDLKHGYFSL